MNKQEAIQKKAKIESQRLLLLQEVFVIEQERESLQSIINAPESDWFVPDDGEDYYLLFGDTIGHFVKNGNLDNEVFKRQQVFRTEAEAKLADDKRIATTKYLRKIAELNEGWKPDWDNNNTRKYFAYYLYGRDEFDIDFYYNAQHKDTAWYSVSEKAAQAAIDSLTQNEIELIFKS